MSRQTIVLCALALALCAGVQARQMPPRTISVQAAKAGPALPVVLWHGMGDSCCASYSIGAIADLIRKRLGVYVHSIATGGSALEDVWSSYFGSVNDQVAKVCAQLRDVPELANGYNAVGFSQGGQFLRALVERCQHTGPRAHTLITMGAQHQGVANVPGCSTVPGNLTRTTGEQAPRGQPANLDRSACETMQALLGRGAYLPWVRDHLVQAQYFKDPEHLEQYLSSNPFLPDVNNEKEDKNPQYADNLASLDALVLYQFEQDTTVVPRESSWFGELDPVDRHVIDVKDTPLYKEDWIGLRRLDRAGKLHLATAPGEHMQFSLEWFETEVMWRYLSTAAPARSQASV